jgi:hypothetical protein
MKDGDMEKESQTFVLFLNDIPSHHLAFINERTKPSHIKK